MEPYDKVKLIVEYLTKYPEAFTCEEKNSIVTYITDSEYEFFIPDIMRELYDELNILPENKSLYKAFMLLVDDIFKIKNKKIVEVGGGIIPTLGKRISKFQDSGKITIYDPRLSIYEKDTDRMVLKREKFNIKTDIRGNDLLIGLMPCEAANVIVESALKNKMDFALALCEGGPHGDMFDYFEDEEEWRMSLIQYAAAMVEEQNMGKLKIKYLKEYGDPYPIIYNERG